MKITGIEAHDLTIPYEAECHPAWAPGLVETARDVTLVVVHTDAGIKGYASGNGHSSGKVRKAVSPYLVGTSPYLVGQHLRVLQNAGGVWWFELALWDIIGKAANQPLHRLWGAARDKVKAYASTAEHGTPEERAEQALHYRDKGFRAMKLHIHGETLAEDLEYVDAVLDAVGDTMEVMVDANQALMMAPSPFPGPQWDYQRAYRTARELEDRGVTWLEEPLGRWDFDNLARLARNAEIYIAGGEKNAAHDFRFMVEKGAYDILQPDVAITTSLSQVMNIKALCETFNLHFMPHHGVNAFGMAATLQLLSTYSGWTYLEYMYDPPYRTVETYQCLGRIVSTPLLIDEDGYIAPPQGPGLGLEIDEGMIQQYVVG